MDWTMNIRVFLPWILLTAVIPCCAFGQRAADPAINLVGMHKSPHRTNEAYIEHQEGDALRLAFDRKHSTVVGDVTAIAWMTDYLLAYSVSPIYGKPGIFKYDYRSGKSEVVVKPTSYDTGYPEGADFFQLHSVDRIHKVLIFYYGKHVDSIDFNKFWTLEHLFKVNLDGTGFTRLKR
jgi:hypothetical protein